MYKITGIVILNKYIRQCTFFSDAGATLKPTPSLTPSHALSVTSAPSNHTFLRLWDSIALRDNVTMTGPGSGVRERVRENIGYRDAPASKKKYMLSSV